MENFKTLITYWLGKTDKHGNPYTILDGKKYLINPTKNITVYGSHGHPAHVRYPHLKEKGPTDAVYTPWQKVFAWKPVKVKDGRVIWLSYVYKRKRTVEWTPPQFPPKGLDQTEYATWDQVTEIELMRN